MTKKIITVLVTGAKGFIGKNLITRLKPRTEYKIIEYDLDSPSGTLAKGLGQADVVCHLAGVNRPDKDIEFTQGNADFTLQLCDSLREIGRRPAFLLSSSIQAVLENPYGISKRQSEEAVLNYSNSTGAPAVIFRLPGVFGKWCRPNYNSVVATFCHHIASGQPITVSDPNKEIELVYIDDVVQAFNQVIDGHCPNTEGKYAQINPSYRVSLGTLAEKIQSFRDSRRHLEIADMSDPFNFALYATYISYLATNSFAYPLTQRSDPRGELAELIKSPHIGQIFISRTRPGITRGHHYHDSKVEKFIVLDGDAIIRFRHILEDAVVEYPVSGYEFRVVDIPPGYTHSIENIGKNDLIVLFWANEIFDPDVPDTFGMPV